MRPCTQVHDGKLDGVATACSNGGCCGGTSSSCGSDGGVANVVYDITATSTACPVAPSNPGLGGCTLDSQCTDSSMLTGKPCGRLACVAGSW